MLTYIREDDTYQTFARRVALLLGDSVSESTNHIESEQPRLGRDLKETNNNNNINNNNNNKNSSRPAPTSCDDLNIAMQALTYHFHALNPIDATLEITLSNYSNSNSMTCRLR